MTYSTCSLNPIENEAVVSEILRRCKGAVQLVDTRSALPQLQRREGLSSWMVTDDSLQVYGCYEDVPENRRKLIGPSVFPSAQAGSQHLEWCMRLMPHHQNTGGFFVCLLEKVAELPMIGDEEMDHSNRDGDSIDRTKSSMAREGGGREEEEEEGEKEKEKPSLSQDIGVDLVGSVKNEQEEFSRQPHKEMLIAWNHTE